MTDAAASTVQAASDRFGRFCSDLGPGLITGCADDDPSGISTYSIAGPRSATGFYGRHWLVRQDLLDQIVWDEVIRLLEDPTLIQQELDRRLAAARASDPTKKREQSLQRELIQVGKGIERLLTAYQEGLLSIKQLRERMQALRNREQMLRSELQAITEQINDRAAFLRLAETLTAFLVRLRNNAETLDVAERQRIVRLVVKEVLVGENDITIRHSIPIPSGSPPNGGSPSAGAPNYLLCKGGDHRTLRSAHLRILPFTVLRHSGLQPLLDQREHPGIGKRGAGETLAANLGRDYRKILGCLHPAQSSPSSA